MKKLSAGQILLKPFLKYGNFFLIDGNSCNPDLIEVPKRNNILFIFKQGKRFEA